MDDRIARIIRNLANFEGIAQFEKNAAQRNALDDDVRAAIKQRSVELGRTLITQRTGLDLTALSPAEEKIVQAVSEYVGVMKREGKNATRTFLQLKNRGLIDSAETAVAKLKPTQGFQTLADADLSDLSYEQIIIDNPDEFSARALWYARRTLELPNESDKPPARSITPVQIRTEKLLTWLRARAKAHGSRLPPHTNAEAAAVLGMSDMHQFGRVFGNIQSRIDYACYEADLPPLGLTATEPFAMAWNQFDRAWAFPVQSMQTAAQAHVWREKDFDRILRETESLPGQAYISWKAALSGHEDKVRSWAFGLSEPRLVDVDDITPEMEARKGRNPAWSRDELILALDLYLRFRAAPLGKDSDEVLELSAFLGQLGSVRGQTDAETFRNANGVYMKMMNFRRFDPEYTVEGKVGLTRGNKEEEIVWNDFASDPLGLAAAVAGIKSGVAASNDAPYWVFVCNPKKWAIDRFLEQRIERDTWGVRPSDRDRFAPGQLGIVRVGVDQRTIDERDGRPTLEAGIYGLCEVESVAFDGTGAASDFWSVGTERAPGWPTVKIRYLRSYLGNPLTIERLRTERADVSGLLLNGFQASSFPISAHDFHAVMDLLKEDLDALPLPAGLETIAADQLAEVEEQFINASPEVKTKVSKYIERGPIGGLVKMHNGFKCQICDALGQKPVGFIKRNGQPYVEAHHVMPVAKKQVGSLSASNVMTVCANHHRQLHYGGIDVIITAETFVFSVDGVQLHIPRLAVSDLMKSAATTGTSMVAE